MRISRKVSSTTDLIVQRYCGIIHRMRLIKITVNFIRKYRIICVTQGVARDLAERIVKILYIVSLVVNLGFNGIRGQFFMSECIVSYTSASQFVVVCPFVPV